MNRNMEMQMLLISASTERECSAYTIRRGGGGGKGCRSNNKKVSRFKDKDASEFHNIATLKMHKSCNSVFDRGLTALSF